MFQDKQDALGWTIKIKSLPKNIIGCAFKHESTLGKGFLNFSYEYE